MPTELILAGVVVVVTISLIVGARFFGKKRDPSA